MPKLVTPSCWRKGTKRSVPPISSLAYDTPVFMERPPFWLFPPMMVPRMRPVVGGLDQTVWERVLPSKSSLNASVLPGVSAAEDSPDAVWRIWIPGTTAKDPLDTVEQIVRRRGGPCHRLLPYSTPRFTRLW